jgi:hypothetical protein
LQRKPAHKLRKRDNRCPHVLSRVADHNFAASSRERTCLRQPIFPAPPSYFDDDNFDREQSESKATLDSMAAQLGKSLMRGDCADWAIAVAERPLSERRFCGRYLRPVGHASIKSRETCASNYY